jgi:hypothetical protein
MQLPPCFGGFHLHPDRHHRDSTNRFTPTKNFSIINLGQWLSSPQPCLRTVAQGILSGPV